MVVQVLSVGTPAILSTEGHFRKIPRMADLPRDVRLGSVWPEASRISLIQAAPFLVTTTPKVSLIARTLVSPPG